MSSIDWALQLGRQQDCLPEPWNAAGAVHQCCLVFLSQGLHSGSLLPSPLGADQANLHLSLQSPLLPSLALLVCAERRGPHFLNHYFLIPFSRKNSSVPLHPLGFFLTAAVISTPAPKLKSHRSCQSHGTGPFPAMQVEITNFFFFYSKPFIIFQGSALANAVSEACKKKKLYRQLTEPKPCKMAAICFMANWQCPVS